jgi:phage portal protein BeeE
MSGMKLAMENVAELLNENRYTVEEIARLVGVNNQFVCDVAEMLEQEEEENFYGA